MSKAQERRAAHEAYERDLADAMNERLEEPAPPPPVTNPRSWASDCSSVRHGTHERYKEDRLAGIYKCKWCGQTFDPPTDDDLAIMRQRAVAYQRPQHMRRGKW